MTKNPRIAVLGAGPIGLETALYARSLDLPTTLYERGQLADHVRRWGHVKLFTPFGMNATSLGCRTLKKESVDPPGEQDAQTGREFVTTYLEPLSKSALLKDCLQTHSHVLGVGRRGLLKEEAINDPRRSSRPFRLLVRQFQQGGKYVEREDEADVVIDCTGTYGQHRWIGDSGLPAIGELANQQQISYQVDDILGERRAFYAGKSVLVVGGGYSAATSVCLLAALAEQESTTWTTWLARAAVTQPLKRVANDPLKERDRLAVKANTLATRTDANVEFRASGVVEQIESLGPDKGFKVIGRYGAKTHTWEVDRIIGNVGYSPDTALYRELQMHDCFATLGPANLATHLAKQANADSVMTASPGPNSLRTSEPNFYVLGAKSYGRNSNFFLKTGFDQIRDVFSLILNKPDLNLYAR